MSGRSLRWELARASWITTSLALLLAGASLLVFEFFAYRASVVSDLESQADLIGRSSVAALQFDDGQVAAQTLVALKLRPAVVSAMVTRPDGQVFAVYQRDPAGDATAFARAAALAVAGSRFSGSFVDVTRRIELEGETLGYVSLRAEHNAGQRGRDYLLILLGVLAVTLLLSQFVFARLQKRITQPITDIADVAANVMLRRDWSLRAPPSASPEAARLVSAFNEMMAQVEARTSELEASNRKLENETAERRLAEEELKRLDRRKDEFLATLAHELRNPLAPMMNAAALLQSPRADEPLKQRSRQIIDQQLRHMARLIEDLLDVSRIMTGKLSLERDPVDLAAVVREAVELVAPDADRKGQQLRASTPPGEAPCVLGDAARLSQIFVNLLNNACKYTPPGGRIDVQMQVSDADVRVQVRDTGIGIDPRMHERIFELFEQVDKSIERGAAGLGVGLTLVRQLVHLHGGTVQVDSAGAGQGTCFTVVLPRVPAAAPLPAPPSAPADPAARDVLVADDNVDYAQSLATLLATLGHRVRVVHDGTAACAAAAAAMPEFALLDIGMPGLSGYEVARRIRRMDGGGAVCLVAVTGWGQDADKAEAGQAGFDLHMVKPVAVEQLVAAFAARPRAAAPELRPVSGC